MLRVVIIGWQQLTMLCLQRKVEEKNEMNLRSEKKKNVKLILMSSDIHEKTTNQTNQTTNCTYFVTEHVRISNLEVNE